MIRRRIIGWLLSKYDEYDTYVDVRDRKLFDIKAWILERQFVRDEIDAAYKSGGVNSFHLAHKDIMETFQGDVEKKAEELVNKKLEELLSIIDERKIITFNEKEKSVYIGGVRATAEQLANLKQEAEAIVQFDLWNILNETPKKLAQNALFIDDGKSEIVHAKGRSMLYLLGTQNRILTTLRSYNPK